MGVLFEIIIYVLWYNANIYICIRYKPFTHAMVMITGRKVINLAGNKCIYMSYIHTRETSCQVEVECIYTNKK